MNTQGLPPEFEMKGEKYKIVSTDLQSDKVGFIRLSDKKYFEMDWYILMSKLK